MRLRVIRGKNILLVGDLKAKVLSGNVDVFGRRYQQGDVIEVKKLISVPLVALEDSDLEIEFGEDGYIAETQFKLVPPEWTECATEILTLSPPARVMVIANVDAGKSGFICYVANLAISKGKKVVVINTDTGQSEMNPPTTIGMAKVGKPIIHLSELRYMKAFFVGSTSPAGLFNRSMLGAIKMIHEALKLDPDLILINTTGWVHGSGGRELKETKLLIIDPDYVVLMEKEQGELRYLEAILSKMEKRFRIVPAAPRLRPRSREERRNLRKQYYAKEFEGMKEIQISLDEVAVMFSYFGTGLPLDAEESMKVAQILGYIPEYMEKTSDLVIIITEKTIPQEKVDILSRELGKQVKAINPSVFENLLVGLLDRDANLLALGIIRKFDPVSRVLTIITRANPDEIRIVALGRIKVTPQMEEVEWLEPWCL